MGRDSRNYKKGHQPRPRVQGDDRGHGKPVSKWIEASRDDLSFGWVVLGGTPGGNTIKGVTLTLSHPIKEMRENHSQAVGKATLLGSGCHSLTAVRVTGRKNMAVRLKPETREPEGHDPPPAEWNVNDSSDDRGGRSRVGHHDGPSGLRVSNACIASSCGPAARSGPADNARPAWSTPLAAAGNTRPGVAAGMERTPQSRVRAGNTPAHPHRC